MRRILRYMRREMQGKSQLLKSPAHSLFFSAFISATNPTIHKFSSAANLLFPIRPTHCSEIGSKEIAEEFPSSSSRRSCHCRSSQIFDSLALTKRHFGGPSSEKDFKTNSAGRPNLQTTPGIIFILFCSAQSIERLLKVVTDFCTSKPVSAYDSSEILRSTFLNNGIAGRYDGGVGQ